MVLTEALKIPLTCLVKSCVHSVPICDDLIGRAKFICFAAGAGDGLNPT